MKDTKALLKEAIADAKAVRETALTQAKLALEEAFTPRLQSMFATKLQEAYDDEEAELDEMKDMADENMDIQADIAETTQEEYADHGNEMDEIDLDEILAELENELNEAKGEEDEEEIEAEEDVEDMEDDVKEDEDEEKEVKDLSMDELEDLIKDIISQEVGGDGEIEGEGYEDEAAVDAMDMGGDAEVEADAEDFELEESLDAILAELLGEESLDERKKYGGNKGNIPSADRGTDKKDTAEEEGKEDYKKKKMEEELQLALEAVETLRTELNEVNLLNAKLLYVNKIFKAKNLNESQKLKVVKAFDKAETAKEAKLVYESLSETFSAKAPKSQIKESLGFASKPAGVAAKQTIVEGNDFIARMQKLANIK